jgi:type IV secretory pathway VirB2 component (pilin)
MHSSFRQVSTEPIQTSADWLASFVVGEIAVTLCVLAVAFVGLALMSGRLVLRKGAFVVLGCFVVLGAPSLAAVLIELGNAGEGRSSFSHSASSSPSTLPARDLPPATYDPYAGASLRDDR